MPRTNGKVERFNKTMKEQWLHVRAYTSEEGRRAWLVPFLNDYNHDRTPLSPPKNCEHLQQSASSRPSVEHRCRDLVSPPTRSPGEIPRRIQMALDLTA